MGIYADALVELINSVKQKVHGFKELYDQAVESALLQLNMWAWGFAPENAQITRQNKTKVIILYSEKGGGKSFTIKHFHVEEYNEWDIDAPHVRSWILALLRSIPEFESVVDAIIYNEDNEDALRELRKLLFKYATKGGIQIDKLMGRIHEINVIGSLMHALSGKLMLIELLDNGTGSYFDASIGQLFIRVNKFTGIIGIQGSFLDELNTTYRDELASDRAIILAIPRTFRDLQELAKGSHVHWPLPVREKIKLSRRTRELANKLAVKTLTEMSDARRYELVYKTIMNLTEFVDEETALRALIALIPYYGLLSKVTDYDGLGNKYKRIDREVLVVFNLLTKPIMRISELAYRHNINNWQEKLKISSPFKRQLLSLKKTGWFKFEQLYGDYLIVPKGLFAEFVRAVLSTRKDITRKLDNHELKLLI